MKRIQLLRPINLHMRNRLRRKRDVEELLLVRLGGNHFALYLLLLPALTPVLAPTLA